MLRIAHKKKSIRTREFAGVKIIFDICRRNPHCCDRMEKAWRGWRKRDVDEVIGAGMEKAGRG